MCSGWRRVSVRGFTEGRRCGREPPRQLSAIIGGMSLTDWRPFNENWLRDLRWRLIGRRRFRAVEELPLDEVAEVRVSSQLRPYDPEYKESTTYTWLSVRTVSGARYVSGPAVQTQEQREAMMEAWREHCPRATVAYHRRAPYPAGTGD
ncbi:hypothetical protein GCM10009557_02650 [Virgisporangium ochraceum]|uniref:Uncharacterized protein n=2 Tax=Virgisporangium ochraceum TaxID=65505 RepID=A0A8J4A2T2_9ACTN|nr:hypothetical protein Voc01_077270 [Virgisporangium ochraceum]